MRRVPLVQGKTLLCRLSMATLLLPGSRWSEALEERQDAVPAG